MRIGVLTTDPADVVPAAESGLFGVLLDGPAAPDAADDTGSVTAAQVAVLTQDARVLVRVRLGTEHPVTLAEEVAVLDHLSAGRVVVLLDPGTLDGTAAAEDLALLRACWSGRPVRHHGTRWTVPSGVMGPGMPTSLAVTPLPAQIDLPVWLTRPVPGAGATLPVLATDLADVRRDIQVQPAVADLTGDLDQDRALVTAWADAGATHLLVRPPLPAGRAAAGTPGAAFFGLYVARYLQPEVSMPGFPRIMAEADLPTAWTP
ncbi:MAG TPA: hypothetical protein VGC67_10515 [Cellulomonas sp.]